MNIVLHEPEIPANTGNVGRSCVATGSSLHLIKPLGFEISEKHLRRAGMDYWKYLDLHIYSDFADFLEKNPGARLWLATTKAERPYTEAVFGAEDFLVFGKESRGLPPYILEGRQEQCLRIPMAGGVRSLNLSNAVAVVLYEALRQQSFAGLQQAAPSLA